MHTFLFPIFILCVRFLFHCDLSPSFFFFGVVWLWNIKYLFNPRNKTSQSFHTGVGFENTHTCWLVYLYQNMFLEFGWVGGVEGWYTSAQKYISLCMSAPSWHDRDLVFFVFFLNGMMHYSCKSKSSVQIRHISLVCTQKKWSRLGLLLCLSGSPFLSFVYLALGALQAVRKTITAPLPFTTYLC